MGKIWRFYWPKKGRQTSPYMVMLKILLCYWLRVKHCIGLLQFADQGALKAIDASAEKSFPLSRCRSRQFPFLFLYLLDSFVRRKQEIKSISTDARVADMIAFELNLIKFLCLVWSKHCNVEIDGHLITFVCMVLIKGLQFRSRQPFDYLSLCGWFHRSFAIDSHNITILSMV